MNPPPLSANDPLIERWRRYLRRDPTRWLLAADADPSILLWYQLDIAHRPESAPAVLETRERVLYSDTVQTIFAAQSPDGFWGAEGSLLEPRYRATLWNLALLAELGIPRASRRARAALETVLGHFAILEQKWPEGWNCLTMAHLLRAADYFNCAYDPRVQVLTRELAERAGEGDAFEQPLALLWGFGRWQAEDRPNANFEAAAKKVSEKIAARAVSPPLVFPHFETTDDLFCLRVLAEYDAVNTPTLEGVISRLVQKQNERGEWSTERDIDNLILIPFEQASAASRWVTLNALRVIVKLVI